MVEAEFESKQPNSFCLLFMVIPVHMEVPRLGVESELHLLAYATATAMQDLNCVCSLHHSSGQHWILNPLGKSRDRTHIFMDTSHVLNPLSCKGNFPKGDSLV